MADARLPDAAARGRRVRITFDGDLVEAYEGETVAAALWAHGVRSVRRSTARAEPRGIYCNMGICYDCLVRVDGRTVRSCMTVVRDGLEVEHAE